MDLINDLLKKVSEQQSNLIEEKIKELIKPYMKINYYGHFLEELRHKGYELECFISDEYTEYRITNTLTMKYDYFLKKNNPELKYNNTSCTSTIYISDIIRQINN